MKVRRPEVEVVETDVRSRKVVTREPSKKGSYVMDYKTSHVFPADDTEWKRIHRANDRDNYVMVTQFRFQPTTGKLCFDATDCLHNAGRFVNHVLRGASLKPMCPM